MYFISGVNDDECKLLLFLLFPTETWPSWCVSFEGDGVLQEVSGVWRRREIPTAGSGEDTNKHSLGGRVP